MTDAITARRIRVRTDDLLAMAERLNQSTSRTIRSEARELRQLAQELNEVATDLEPGIAQRQERSNDH